MDFPSTPATTFRRLFEAAGVGKEDVAIWEIGEAFQNVPVCDQLALRGGGAS